jgi:hypothetical protein
MKSIFIFFILLVLTLNFGCSQKDTTPIKVKLSLEKEYTKSLSKNDYWVRNQIDQQSLNVKSDSVIVHYYDITIEIENVGERDIYIWMMTCSWQHNFEINNNYINFYHRGCDSNFPIREKIKSKSKITFNGTVRKNLKFDYPNENSVYGKQIELTKVGLIIIDDFYKPNREMVNYSLNMEDKSKYKLIWSNGINLFRENNRNQKEFN